MKLTAQDLQIGDWVMYNPNVFIEDEYVPTQEQYPTQIKNGEDIDLAIEGCYTPIPITPEILENNEFEYQEGWESTFIEKDAVPCWSLSALLSVINNIKGWYPGIDAQVEDNKWQICMFSRETGSDTSLSSMNEELVDVCYEVIIKLHEQNLI